MSVQSFSEPEAYQGAIQDLDVCVVPCGRGHFKAHHAACMVGDVSLQTGRSEQPLVGYLRRSSDRICIGFAPCGTSLQIIDGVRVDNRHISISAPGMASCYRQAGGEDWATVAVPREKLAGVLGTGWARGLAGAVVVAQPAEAALRRLQWLALMALARGGCMQDCDEKPGRDVTEEDLVEAAALCIGTGSVARHTAAQRRHRAVLARFNRYIETCQGDAPHLSEICTAIGVNVRTFRMCCEEAFGMGPIRFLRLRRLLQARHALLHGGVESVTDVALRYGFNELGRFAGEYARMFGELPSVTLKSVQQKGSASF